ncbi:MAG: NAD(P)H-binding protein [Allosphingosinicella sp.]|uniref:NAD(P)H-binding protein n=1 Tax=Allosphingosinicella sp. TaxID=2823234 RepID=UPI003943ABB1
MRVALIGATGLVGGLLVDRLRAAGHEVHALLRRPAGRAGSGLVEHVADPGRWPEIAQALAADAAISCLGTTMRKAGSRAAFRAVDHDMVLAFARAARAGGARRMAAVSSVGADPGARNFYLRLKGEVEVELAGLGFDRLDIFRPGLLRGERGPERRPMERIGILASPLTDRLLRGRLARYASIDAARVAAAVAATLREEAPGRFVHENAGIARLSESA